jgi:hypothetical protein
MRMNRTIPVARRAWVGTLVVLALTAGGCGGSTPPSPPAAAPPATSAPAAVAPRPSGPEIVVRSLEPDRDVYLFRIEDAAAQRIEFANGTIEGEGRVYLHPDQKVNTLLLHGNGAYRQVLPTDGAVTLLFYKLPSGGRARVEWKGEARDVDLHSTATAGAWERITLAPRT